MQKIDNIMFYTPGDIVQNIKTSQMTIINDERCSFYNVFKNEYILIGQTTQPDNTAQLYDDMIEVHGVKQQLLQSVEEMGELSKEILKFHRYYDTDEEKKEQALYNIYEELGDVYNALDSMVHIFNIDTSSINTSRYIKLVKHHKSLDTTKESNNEEF
jgi:NTP pyrophosphatase (non-canonical NTP hydrolase)